MFRRPCIDTGKGRNIWVLNGGIHDVLNVVWRIVDEIKKRRLTRKTGRFDMRGCSSGRVGDVFDDWLENERWDWESVRLHHTSHHEQETFTPCQLHLKL